MSKESVSELFLFIIPYPKNVKETALWLRDIMWESYPETNELIYDNYNSVALGWSPTDKAGDVFCSIALFSNYVNFGFNRGVDLDDQNEILSGNGSQYRYIRVTDKDLFPVNMMRPLIKAAYENSVARLKPVKKIIQGETIVKSISPVKRRPV